MSMEEILSYKPTGGLTTVLEHLHRMQGWVDGLIDWKTMELTGKDQSYGAKSACDYCSLQRDCHTQATGAPF